MYIVTIRLFKNLINRTEIYGFAQYLLSILNVFYFILHIPLYIYILQLIASRVDLSIVSAFIHNHDEKTDPAKRYSCDAVEIENLVKIDSAFLSHIDSICDSDVKNDNKILLKLLLKVIIYFSHLLWFICTFYMHLLIIIFLTI